MMITRLHIRMTAEPAYALARDAVGMPMATSSPLLPSAEGFSS